MGKTIYMVTIGGVGVKVGGIGYQYWFVTRLPEEYTIPDRYLVGMRKPSSIGASVDVETGTSSLSALNLEVKSTDVTREIFGRSYFQHVAIIQEDIDTTGPFTVEVDDSSGITVGDHVWIGLETMRVSVILVGPPRLTLIRGQYGTRITSHNEGARVYTKPFPLYNRRVKLYKVDENEVTSLLWAGRLEDIPEHGNYASIPIQCSSDLAWFQDWVNRGQPQMYVVDGYQFMYRKTEQSLLDRMIEIVDGSRPAAGDPAAVMRFEDKAVFCEMHYILTSTVTLTNRDFFSGDFNNVKEYTAFELLTSYPNYNIFYRYNLTLTQYEQVTNPIYIALILILSTGEGDNYDVKDDYSYDTLPNGFDNKQTGLGIDRNRLDLDTWENYAATVAKDWETDNVEIGLERCSDVLHKLLWPSGLVPTIGVNQEITLVRLTDVTPLVTSIDITLDDLSATHMATQARVLNRVFQTGVIEYPEGDPDTVLLDQQHRLFSGSGMSEYRIDASYYNRNADANRIRSHVIEYAIRMLSPPPVFKVRVKPSIGDLIAPGTLVKLTHPFLIDSDGTRGLVNAGCYVVEESLLFDEAGGKELVLWYVNHDLTRLGSIHWAMEVQNYDAQNKKAYLFSSFDADGDTNRVSTSQLVLLFDRNGELRSNHAQQNVSISAITLASDPYPDFVTLSHNFKNSGGSTIYPRAHDVLIGVDYDDIDEDEDDSFVFLADTSEKVGAANDDAYDYIG